MRMFFTQITPIFICSTSDSVLEYLWAVMQRCETLESLAWMAETSKGKERRTSVISSLPCFSVTWKGKERKGKFNDKLFGLH